MRCNTHAVRTVAAVLAFLGSVSGVLWGQSTITVEAEDAVSTNFAADAVLLFGTGDNRTLQLNERSLLGETPFYAEYAVYAPEAGEYDLWYGGSIPGSRDTILPSYGSPIVVQINDDAETTLFWEDVQVGATYSSPYRWVLASTVTLREGLNQIRLEVRERRRFDGRYFLYLDRFVLHPTNGEDGDEKFGGVLHEEPESIEDLLIIVRDNPDDIGAWIRLADLYTLVGDNINALRYLNRAAVIQDGNPEILRRTARNLMWRGDLEGALNAYWRVLSADPSRLDSFLEAGKIAAWNGYYGASQQYYLAGLENFPTNVEIRINLGFTYLWSGQEERARELFQRTESTAETPEDAVRIAHEYRLNDDPGRASGYLERAISRFGGHPELYAARYDLLLSLEDRAAADQLLTQARGEVADPEGLAARLQRIDRTYRLRDELIAEFEAAARDNPLDPTPRRTLAQTYLWTGRLDAGIAQFELLLAVESLRTMRQRWDREARSVERAALVAVVERELRAELGRLTAVGSQLNSRLRSLENVDEETPEEEQQTRLDSVQQAADQVRHAVDRIDRLISFVEPTAGENDEELTTATAEARSAATAIAENSNWRLSLPRVQRELSRGEGRIPGIDVHLALVNWILAKERPAPPQNLLAGSAGDTERLLLVWAWATSGQTEALQRVFEEIPADAGRLLLYRELFAHGESDTVDETPSVDGVAVQEMIEAGKAAQTVGVDGQQAASTALRLLREERVARAELMHLMSSVAVFELQNETVALRTQLGGFYLDSGDEPAAIGQFETVREVDPNNPETLFALANAYQQQGRWARAMDTYREIYTIDPSFRNVAALHNRLARNHADNFSAGLRAVAEPTRVVMGSRTGYTYRVNSRFDLVGELEATGTRVLVEGDQDIRRQYFQQGFFTLSAPIRFDGGQLVVEPMIGVDLNGNHFFIIQDAEKSIMTFERPLTFRDRADYFQYWEAKPILGTSVRYSGDDSFTSLSYRFGPYRPADDLPKETSFISRPEYVAHSVTGSLSFSLAGHASPFWSRMRSETNATADFITGGSDQGQRVAARQNLGFVLYVQSQPHTRVATGLSTGYEDYFGEDSSLDYDVFYRPDEVFQAGSYVTGELYRSGGGDTTLGLSGRLYGGLYQTRLLDSSSPDPLKLESGFRGAADLTAEITRRAVAFQLGTSLSRVWDGAIESEDFYSIGVSLNVIVTNPSLLAQ